MADDNHSRYRPNDPYARGAAPAAPNNDPLAELARLIGQNDAFPDYGRPPAQPGAPRYGNPAPSYGHEPNYGSNPAPSYGHDATQHYPGEPDPPSGHDAGAHYESEPRYEEPPRYADERAPYNDWHNGGTPAPSYRPDDQFALPLPHQAPLSGARPYDNTDYGAPAYGKQGYGNEDYANQDSASPNYADPPGQPPRDSYRPEPDFDAGQSYPPPLYPHEPEAGSMPPPHDDEFYDDAPGGRRRRSFMTVVAVLALAVIGTAGAFGYRSLFSGPSVPATPPVIRASGEPNKIEPPPAPDQSVSKFTYDRFSDAGKDERMVPRDEKPVDLSKLTPPPAAPAASTRGGTANAPSAIGDPRRVRTVPIRPNQPDAAAAIAAAPPAPTAPPRQAVVANDPPQQAEPRAAAPAKTTARTPRSAPPAANAPLSLSPDANNALPPPSAARESAPAPPRAPARVASAPASGGGSYLVQVSSQKSEADAESSYRGISSKFSSVIGGKPHTVRRADLGSKGVYYRAMIGPFGSREEAVSLCTNLKQAGGDCVVQH